MQQSNKRLKILTISWSFFIKNLIEFLKLSKLCDPQKEVIVLFIHMLSKDYCDYFIALVTLNASGPNNRGEGKRRNEFAEWHVAWLAE